MHQADKGHSTLKHYAALNDTQKGDQEWISVGFILQWHMREGLECTGIIITGIYIYDAHVLRSGVGSGCLFLSVGTKNTTK